MSDPIQNPKSEIQNSRANDLTSSLKTAAHRLGFTLTGVCPAVAPTGVSRLAQWLDRGYAGEMHYIASRQDAYSHPRHVLGGVRSILMLGLPYASNPKSKIENLTSPCARISRYALGTDYHDIIHDKLKSLIAALHKLAPDAQARGVVDTAPLLEREFAQLAGLGWIGKHTLLINKPAGAKSPSSVPGSPLGPHEREAPASYCGSYFFLAALLTDLILDYDDPFTADHCGTCRACLDACPTQAFPQPYVLDASRCISYLTIELKSPIPRDLRSGIGDWLFGCDVCQDVCPWNQRTQARSASEGPGSEDDSHPSVPGSALGPQDPEVPASSAWIDLVALFSLDDESFRRRFHHTPLWRPRRRGILRNAAIVLGNRFRGVGTQARSASEGPGSDHAPQSLSATDAIAALTRGLNDLEPLVRGASAWALGQIGGDEAHRALRRRLCHESDSIVRDEIESAVAASQRTMDH